MVIESGFNLGMEELTMYDRKVSYYNVIIYKKTILNEYHKERIIKFSEIEKAVEFGKSEIAKGNKVRIEEIADIANWN